ncbi:low temperature requirement protein A [Microbacterium ulmi]|uniref:Low temperature requirement protein A n=1 Tax=Microbacterium ulmi TaxID=179095 RepID=A0A7Y2M2C1_9MICO|nr:low temperature requirement protein A [Microbacterium ulmi]NII70532.1 low temperature requirement protein LtrA [Microbacterium ulmi]NNH05210.1 low temperature requirement protein A [Microbacterium ulmi]
MSLSHHMGRMSGRDPEESHRAATPLELLFDLTFVVAFSSAGSETAHFLELGEIGPALLAFWFSIFAVSWAWINYSWLASAYDNDDVFFRIATLVEMVGVLILTLGIPPFFHSIQEGRHVDNSIMVAGYVVMRIAAIALWLRAAANDPVRRRTCLAYAANIGIAQAGWVVLIFLDLSLPMTFLLTALLSLFELAGPVSAELRYGRTPWNPHHIAERYGLLVIITLGEVILGTTLSISAVVHEEGWSAEAVLVASGGTLLAFAMWWMYFVLPVGELLERYPLRAFPWGYGHVFLFGSIAGVGAGLHVAANVIRDEAHVGALFAVLCVAVPLFAFELMAFTLFSLLVKEIDVFHVWTLAAAVAVLALGVVAVLLGATLGVSLVVLACSPVVIVVAYETVGHRHEAATLERALAR